MENTTLLWVGVFFAILVLIAWFGWWVEIGSAEKHMQEAECEVSLLYPELAAAVRALPRSRAEINQAEPSKEDPGVCCKQK